MNQQLGGVRGERKRVAGPKYACVAPLGRPRLTPALASDLQGADSVIIAAADTVMELPSRELIGYGDVSP